MSILNNDILTKEYTEKNVPISLPLLYDMGWEFELIDESNHDVAKHPNRGELLNETFFLPRYYNQYWLKKEDSLIRISYGFGAVVGRDDGASMIHPARITDFIWMERPIRTWYDLKLIQQYGKLKKEMDEIGKELLTIQKSYEHQA